MTEQYEDVERSLVIKFKAAKETKAKAKEDAAIATKAYEEIEAELIEALDARGAEATARFEGIGYARAMKPKLYASFKKENEGDVFKFLIESDRSDLIKETVNASSLSSFVKDNIEAGEDVPDFITYYLKRTVNVY